MKAFYRCCLLLVSCFSIVAAQAQVSNSKDSPVTAPPLTVVERVQRVADQEAVKNREKFTETLRKRKQEELLNDVKTLTQKAGDYLKNRLDTNAINKELNKTGEQLNIASDGIFSADVTAHTYRNLASSYKIIFELLAKTNTRKAQVDHYYKTISGYRYAIDSLNADTSLYHFPNDSAELVRYSKRYAFIAAEMSHIDSAIDLAIITAQQMQAKTNMLVYKLDATLAEIERHQQHLAGNMLGRELGNIGTTAPGRSFKETVILSAKKGGLGFVFYIADHWGKLLLLFTLLTISCIFLRSLKQKLQEGEKLNDEMDGQLVFRYPFLSSAVIVFSIFQFLFPDPPFLFNLLLWSGSAVSLAFIFKNFINRFWMKFWLAILLLSVQAGLINLLLLASDTERWLMILLALPGIFSGIYFLSKRKKQPLRENLIIYFIWLMIIAEAAAIFTNIFGRYNLSKALFVSGYLNVLLGILFLWTVRLINETLHHAAQTYQSPQKNSFYLNFSKVGNKAPAWLYLLLILGWFILIGRNFYVFKKIAAPVTLFFTSERSIGSFNFDIGDILLFFSIIILSVLVSRVISFFASEPYQRSHSGDKEHKAGLGSWLLLIRVAVIASGLLLALAASGFPMDRITIILGALGVGIGLGLQTIVNNLVSGILIAFEKPVNVGDVIDFGGQQGTMKSIGFRSSVITTLDGADMIVPNGDLLNSHLINWSMGGNKRRFEIIVGVAYQTNLHTAQQLLEATLKNDPRILPYPLPQVVFHEFGESGINLKILYWVRSLKEGLDLKSDLIIAIEKTFAENNIAIPYPQQDVNIRFPGAGKEEKGPGEKS